MPAAPPNQDRPAQPGHADPSIELSAEARRRPDDPRHWRRRDGIALLLVLAMAFLLRLWRLDDLGLWHDEALAWQRASGDWATLLRGRPIDQDPPLLALLLRGWMALGGESEAWLRLPGVVAGAATAGLAALWLGRRAGARAGLLLAALFALSPAQVHYARELNQYAFLPLLTLWLVVAHEALVRSPQPKRALQTRPWAWRAFGLASVIALGTHYGLAFPIGLLTLDLWRRARVPEGVVAMRDLGRYLGLLVLFGLLLVGLGLGERALLPHLDPRIFGTSLVKEIDYLADRLWRELLVFQWLPFSGGAALGPVAALSTMALWGLRTVGREERGRTWVRQVAEREVTGSARARQVAVPSIPTLLFGTLLLAYPADLLGMYPLGNRWGLFFSPFLLAALALGLNALSRESRALGAAAVLATASIFLAFLPQMDERNPYFDLPREQTREAVVALEEDLEAEDRVFVWHAALPAFDYHASRSSARAIRGAHPEREPIEAQVERLLEGLSTSSVATSETGRRWILLERIDTDEQATLIAAIGARGFDLASTRFGEGASLSRLVPARATKP